MFWGYTGVGNFNTLRTQGHIDESPHQHLTRQLIFKSLKSIFRLADITSANTKIVHVLLFSALIATIIAPNRLHYLHCSSEGKEEPFRLEAPVSKGTFLAD
jgi:hypothetical protein